MNHLASVWVRQRECLHCRKELPNDTEIVVCGSCFRAMHLECCQKTRKCATPGCQGTVFDACLCGTEFLEELQGKTARISALDAELGDLASGNDRAAKEVLKAEVTAGAEKAGTRITNDSLPTIRITQESCSYCRQPFLDNTEIAVCKTCRSILHVPCCQESGECVKVGCRGSIFEVYVYRTEILQELQSATPRLSVFDHNLGRTAAEDDARVRNLLEDQSITDQENKGANAIALGNAGPGKEKPPQLRAVEWLRLPYRQLLGRKFGEKAGRRKILAFVIAALFPLYTFWNSFEEERMRKDLKDATIQETLSSGKS